MHLPARILYGLTLATAGHLPAPAHSCEQGDPPQTNNPEPSSMSAGQPATAQPVQDNTQQAQSPSQEKVPPSPQDPAPAPPERPVERPKESTEPETPPSRADHKPWLDRTRQGVYDTLWHSAMRVDRRSPSGLAGVQYQCPCGGSPFDSASSSCTCCAS
jgi:hypothetical protein